jgi:hypothetical protein
MQHLEGSGTPVLYIGRTDLKGLMREVYLSNMQKFSICISENMVSPVQT